MLWTWRWSSCKWSVEEKHMHWIKSERTASQLLTDGARDWVACHLEASLETWCSTNQTSKWTQGGQTTNRERHFDEQRNWALENEEHAGGASTRITKIRPKSPWFVPKNCTDHHKGVGKHTVKDHCPNSTQTPGKSNHSQEHEKIPKIRKLLGTRCTRGIDPHHLVHLYISQ
jgi:hypothetical protein